MAHSEWCGKECSGCNDIFNCPVDLEMPCSPDCEAIDPKTNQGDIKVCIECGANLEEVTEREYQDILEIIEQRIPIGRFYYKKEDDLTIGIDIETRDAEIKEFNSLEACFRWLYGEDTE